MSTQLGKMGLIATVCPHCEEEIVVKENSTKCPLCGYEESDG